MELMHAEDPFAGLDHDLNGAGKAKQQRETFPCEHCHGTGKWRGGRNRAGESKCFACGGRGHFLSSRADRQRARAKASQRKAKRILDAQEAFNEQHPGFIEELIPMIGWNDFARSLVEQYNTKGALTDNQVSAARWMIAKVAKTRAERVKIVVDLSPIRAMFDYAVSHNHPKPKYLAEGLVITLAPSYGANAGALYVKTYEEGEYQGKIVGTEYRPVRSALDWVPAALQRIAQDPHEASVRYGRKIGRCGMCGATLTKKESIERGIGPICAGKMGF